MIAVCEEIEATAVGPTPVATDVIRLAELGAKGVVVIDRTGRVMTLCDPMAIERLGEKIMTYDAHWDGWSTRPVDGPWQQITYFPPKSGPERL